MKDKLQNIEKDKDPDPLGSWACKKKKKCGQYITNYLKNHLWSWYWDIMYQVITVCQEPSEVFTQALF